MQQIKVGEIYPDGCPGEGPVALISGGSFNVAIFESNLTARTVKWFKNQPLRTGVLIYEKGKVPVPFFIVRLLGTDWFFDVFLNLPAEPAEQASAFVEREGNIIVLILCDYPSGRVRAIRAISIELETMKRIKEACEQQTTTRAVNVSIDECYAQVSLEQMINEVIVQ